MTRKIEVPRELLERCLRANDEPQPSQLYADLRALLDAIEPQSLQPAAYLVTDIHGQKKALRAGAEGIERHRSSGSILEPLYRAPLSPDHSAPICIYWDAKTQNCMDTTPDHSGGAGKVAWNEEAKTLFRDILGWADSNVTWSEIEFRIRTCLDKVKELNQ